MTTARDKVDISAVEDHGGILTIRGGGKRRDWNGIHYKQGMSRKNVGTANLSANIATITPGGVAYAHIHVGFEVILYIIEGKVRHEFGDGLTLIAAGVVAGEQLVTSLPISEDACRCAHDGFSLACVARSSNHNVHT